VALGDDLLTHRGIQRAVQIVQQQHAGIAVAQPPGRQLGEPSQDLIADTGAGGEHERDLLGEEPAGHEPQDLGGGLVEPLGVLDHTDQRLGLGDLGHQRQGGQPDQEPVGRRAGGAAEHGGQGVALGGGQPVQVLQHGPTELVEAGVGQLHLRLHPGGPGDLPAVDPIR
jgi:hypothetical protein